jgi:hypothetical protein
VGIPRGPDVPTVGRFKLSEIANTDQTPLLFEYNNGKTYAKKGSKTVWVKEQRSGCNKRQQLSNCAFTLTVNHTLLLFLSFEVKPEQLPPIDLPVRQRL